MYCAAQINASQTLGGASGRTYPVGAYAPCVFGCGHVLLTTTATVGSRNLALKLLDASGNILFEGQAQATVAASTTARLNWGAGMISGTGGAFQYMGVPDMPLPPGAQVNVLDLANIDANDTIQCSTTVTM